MFICSVLVVCLIVVVVWWFVLAAGPKSQPECSQIIHVTNCLFYLFKFRFAHSLRCKWRCLCLANAPIWIGRCESGPCLEQKLFSEIKWIKMVKDLCLSVSVCPLRTLSRSSSMHCINEEGFSWTRVKNIFGTWFSLNFGHRRESVIKGKFSAVGTLQWIRSFEAIDSFLKIRFERMPISLDACAFRQTKFASCSNSFETCERRCCETGDPIRCVNEVGTNLIHAPRTRKMK